MAIEHVEAHPCAQGEEPARKHPPLTPDQLGRSFRFLTSLKEPLYARDDLSVLTAIVGQAMLYQSKRDAAMVRAVCEKLLDTMRASNARVVGRDEIARILESLAGAIEEGR
ncbi:MAG: hypothetical protein HOW73_43275 [Polyangiaceae bacterium]|nr:hypothetical protein [Polyangiaceae bacterium]